MPIVGHAEDGSRELRQNLANYWGGEGREVAGGLVQQQDIAATEHHSQKQQLGALASAEGGGGMVHLLCLVLHGPQQGAGPGDVLFPPGGGQNLHGSQAPGQLVEVVLGHIGGPNVVPGQKLVRQQLEQGGLAHSVGAYNANLLRASHPKMNVLGQYPISSGELGQVQA